MRDDVDDTEERDERLGANVFARLEPETEMAVRQIAKVEGRSVSNTIRRLLKEALAARDGRAA